MCSRYRNGRPSKKSKSPPLTMGHGFGGASGHGGAPVTILGIWRGLIIGGGGRMVVTGPRSDLDFINETSEFDCSGVGFIVDFTGEGVGARRGARTCFLTGVGGLWSKSLVLYSRR